MRIALLLLRLLLCVSLAANGVGLVQASTRMHLAHAASDVRVEMPAATPQATSACHDMAPEVGAPSMAMLDASAAAGASSDCCDGDACGCTCTATGSAAYLPAHASRAELGPAPVACEASADHCAPRLPHLIRPPIG